MKHVNLSQTRSISRSVFIWVDPDYQGHKKTRHVAESTVLDEFGAHGYLHTADKPGCIIPWDSCRMSAKTGFLGTQEPHPMICYIFLNSF